MKYVEPKIKPLSPDEVRQAFEPVAEKYPPLLTLVAAAALSGYAPATLRKKLSQGCFRNSAVRGKPLRFWRDRFVIELMNRSEQTTRYRIKSAGEALEGGAK